MKLIKKITFVLMHLVFLAGCVETDTELYDRTPPQQISEERMEFEKQINLYEELAALPDSPFEKVELSDEEKEELFHLVYPEESDQNLDIDQSDARLMVASSIPLGTIIRFRAENYSKEVECLEQVGDPTCTLSASVSNGKSFKVVQALDPNCNNCVSFQSTGNPDYYLNHYYYKIRVDRIPWGNVNQFNSDASFKVTSPLSGSSNSYSFKAGNLSNHYIRHYYWKTYVHSYNPFSSTYKKDASWKID